MVHEEKLAAVLSEFARELTTDIPVRRVLQRFAEQIVQMLPVTAVGVTLMSARMPPRLVVASDDAALGFDRLQTDFGQGPCPAAYESGEAVVVEDLGADDRFPEFAPAAVSAGLAAVFSFPLRHGKGRIGALNLYRDTAGGIDEHDMEVAQTLADVAAACLVLAQARDDARAASDEYHYSTLHDPLTGLPNRLLLQERLEHAARRARRSRMIAAILFVDLDRFRAVNDNYGHQVGDELLIAVAHRLTDVVRFGDTLARLSGDEFVFLCEDVSSPEDAEMLARRVDRAFVDPFELSAMTVGLTASVGVAFAGPGEDVSDKLLVNADIAMYQAKRRGGAGHRIFDLRDALDTEHSDDLELALRSALADDDLAVVYQPIVRCTDGHITGVEALLRWTHPEQGPVPPLSILAIAEGSPTLVSDIGTWVLERSCRDWGRWSDKHRDRPLDLAVNVSARQLMSGDFSDTMARVLDRTGMDPTALVLEVTENIFIEDSEQAVSALLGLTEQGVRIALDDFGTGYSSLSFLRRLPIDVVKIDRSLIGSFRDTGVGAAIVAAVTDMAHALDLTVTAEGVETQDESDAVHAIGCESAQGFFYARPMPGSAIDDRLKALTGTAPGRHARP